LPVKSKDYNRFTFQATSRAQIDEVEFGWLQHDAYLLTR